jgi:hypothetical protein
MKNLNLDLSLETQLHLKILYNEVDDCNDIQKLKELTKQAIKLQLTYHSVIKDLLC